MKKIALICLVALATKVNSQIYFGEKCSIKFFSEAKMENIDAENKAVKPVLNAKDGHFVIQASQTGFVFKSNLMQEHFNENYMESDKFPYAKFDGIIKEKLDFTKDGSYNVNIDGKLSMHGVELPRTITGTVVIKNGVVIMDSKFDVKVEDYKIKVPSLYVEKIAEVIQITYHAELVARK